jgi:hypothetical protein
MVNLRRGLSSAAAARWQAPGTEAAAPTAVFSQ